MSAIGWITAARRFRFASVFRRSRARKSAGRKVTPGLESLESIDLMSSGLSSLAAVTALGTPVAPSAYQVTTSSTMDTMTQTTTLQTVTVPSTLTNFTASFNPAITLFDPSLGTLTAVHVTVQAALTAQIKSQNTSTTSPADITAFIDPARSNFTVTGLSQAVGDSLGMSSGPVSVSANTGSDPLFGGASTALWTSPPYPSTVPVNQTNPPLTASDSQSYILTSASDLAFYTASTGRTTVTPTLSETAAVSASAPNGNLQTQTLTSGSGAITVTYDFTPRCPNVVSLVRFGIHHQATQLQLTFDGPIIPSTDATNVSNYRVVVPNRYGSFTGPGVSYVAVNWAVYDQTNNTVTLTTARPLNVHKLFELQVKLPCNNGNIVTIEFGGKKSLGGYINPHAGNAVVKVANGKVVKG